MSRLYKFAYGVRQLLLDFLWFVALFIFGWAYETYQELVKYHVKLKENVQSIYQRAIYKELRFFHS